MTELIKQMRKIIGNHWSSHIQITIFSEDEICLRIYESEIPLVVDLKKKEVYLDCEGLKNQLTSSMLIELGSIAKLVEDNWDVLEDLMKED